MVPEGGCLRYPENLGVHNSLSHDMAASMLLRAVQLSTQTPFHWGYIDRPSDGQLFLIFVPHNFPFPVDGIRYQEAEQRFTLPLPQGREMEIMEVKFGFIPGHDNVAQRTRRRYRLIRGGHPHLVLIHYSRGPAIPIVPSQNQPARTYPLQPINDPPTFVIGPRQGQKVFPPGAMQAPGMQERGQSIPPGMAMGNPQAMLAQQNSNMEALERRSQRDRDRSGSVTNRGQHPQARIEEDDVDEDSDMISIRALALTRYRRNHEFMNEVFMHAAFGKQLEAKPKPQGYSIFNKDELAASVSKLESEIAELQAKAAARKQAREASDLADVSMESLSMEATSA